MAFTTLNFTPIGGQSKRGAAPQEYSYRTTDSVATMDTSGYFNTVAALLDVGDRIRVQVVDSITAPTAITADQTLVVQANASGVIDTYNSKPTDKIYLTVTMADISVPSSVWVTAPVACTFTKAYVTLNGAITAADSILTSKIATVAVTGGGATAANAGSAAGTVFTISPTAANTLIAGQALELITDGASSTTAIATWTVELTPTTPVDSD